MVKTLLDTISAMFHSPKYKNPDHLRLDWCWYSPDEIIVYVENTPDEDFIF